MLERRLSGTLIEGVATKGCYASGCSSIRFVVAIELRRCWQVRRKVDDFFVGWADIERLNGSSEHIDKVCSFDRATFQVSFFNIGTFRVDLSRIVCNSSSSSHSTKLEHGAHMEINDLNILKNALTCRGSFGNLLI